MYQNYPKYSPYFFFHFLFFSFFFSHFLCKNRGPWILKSTLNCCKTSPRISQIYFSRISPLDFLACLPEFSQPSLLKIPLYSLGFVESSQIFNQISSKINPNIFNLLDFGVVDKRNHKYSRGTGYSSTSPAFTLLKLTIETLKQGVKYVES